jgi:hypothetical protein
MHCFAISACALLATFTINPAAAQIVGPRPPSDYRAPNPFIGDSSLPGPGTGRDVGDIRNRIDRARESGSISKREARQLDREARLIRRLERRYASDGLSASEKRELETRALYLRGALNRPRLEATGADKR